MLFHTDDGTGPAVVLVHGNGEDHTIFDKLIPVLSTNHRVVAVDLRGHGQSRPLDKGEALHYQDMADDVLELMDELNLERPALVGFSDGGIVGLLIASQHPDRLGKLIAMGANSNPDGISGNVRRGMKIAWFFTRSPKLRLMLDEPHLSADDLAKITVPTLLLAGSKDLIRETDTRFLARSIPNAQLKIVDGEDHMSYVVHSEKLYPLIAGFLG